MRTLILVALVCLGHSTPYAATVLAADRDWAEVKGWKVYWNAGIEGCFAERAQPDGTQVLLGMSGKDNQLAIGFRNDTLNFAKKAETYQLKLLFDGRSSWDNGMIVYDFGNGPLLLGSYGGAAKFRAEIAKSNKLTINLGKQALAAISLKGSSAAFKAVDKSGTRKANRKTDRRLPTGSTERRWPRQISWRKRPIHFLRPVTTPKPSRCIAALLRSA